jgi:hypothetical protein
MANRFILKNKYGFTDQEIKTYQNLNNGDSSGIEYKFISQAKYQDFRKYIDKVRWRSIVHNKWITANYYSNAEGISQPEHYGLLHPASGYRTDGKLLRNYKDLISLIDDKKLDSLVIKHVGGGVGQSVFIINKTRNSGGEIELTINTGDVLTENDVKLILKKTEGELQGYIVEERIKSHPVIETINHGGLSSIRINTLRNGDGFCEPQVAFIRLGLNGKETDHSSNGGIMAPIDLHEGKTGKGLKIVNNEAYWVSVHPDTNENIEGFTIPFWDKILKMVTNAANMSPGLNWVGWDVVVSPDKPYLIEGNVGNNIMLYQMVFGGFLTNNVFNDWVEHLVPENKKNKISTELTNWRSRFVKKKLKHGLRI